VEATVGSGERALVIVVRALAIGVRRAALAGGVLLAATMLGPARAGSGATAAAGAGSAASAADGYENEWINRVRPWPRQAVARVTIDAVGLGDAERRATSEPEPCTTFRPSERQIRTFVTRARRISQRDFLHETDWSACHAVGHLRWQGGGSAEWMVQRFGAGYVSIAGARHYLDCPDCALGDVSARGKAR
jgi:hypothetical protein